MVRILRYGLTACLYLIGAFVIALLLTGLIQAPLNMGQRVENIISLIILGIVAGAGCAGWGRALARMHDLSQQNRMMIFGGACYAISLLAVGITLSLLEGVALGGLGLGLPVHNVFTLLFVSGTFLVILVTATGLGYAAGGWTVGWRTGLIGGGSGALAFLLVNIVMDLLGWRVGAPDAESRATMSTVTLIGLVAATFVAGIVVSLVLEYTGATDTNDQAEEDQYATA